jgi:pimeloyl-ACP methyl ester carboxylesterase
MINNLFMNNVIKNTVAAITIFLSGSCLLAQKGESWSASRETVEKLSKDNKEFNYYEEKVPEYSLPDVLIMNDGTAVKSPGEWKNERRGEILEMFRSNVFGRVPETRYEESFKIINTDKNAMGGASTLKQIEVNITSEGKTLVINLTLFTPNNSGKPVPAFLLINNRGAAVADPLRKTKSEFWPAEEVIARGYAIAVFNNSDLDVDKFDDFKDGIHAVLDRGARNGDAWGTIAAWAWGASRCMDYLIQDKAIDAGKVAVVGHSRGGKTALWAGAEDTRFALVVSNESGCTGAALARRKFGETVKRINTSFPHWFCTNYRKYNDNEDKLPVDMHMLLSLTAPRALYVACASDDLWGDPKGSYMSLYNAVPVFSLLGKKSGIPAAMPPLEKQLISGNVAFHVREGNHNMLLTDWNRFMDFADIVLKKK